MMFPWHEFNSSSFPNGKKIKLNVLLCLQLKELGWINLTVVSVICYSPWIAVFKKKKKGIMTSCFRAFFANPFLFKLMFVTVPINSI